jgi:hypothetical protein
MLGILAVLLVVCWVVDQVLDDVREIHRGRRKRRR